MNLWDWSLPLLFPMFFSWLRKLGLLKQQKTLWPELNYEEVVSGKCEGNSVHRSHNCFISFLLELILVCNMIYPARLHYGIQLSMCLNSFVKLKCKALQKELKNLCCSQFPNLLHIRSVCDYISYFHSSSYCVITIIIQQTFFFFFKCVSMYVQVYLWST